VLDDCEEFRGCSISNVITCPGIFSKETEDENDDKDSVLIKETEEN
jgi:hypothetical protein